MKRTLLLFIFAACSSKSPAPTTTPSEGSSAGSGSAVENTEPAGSAAAPATAPKMGEKCGDGDSCATGLTCVSYYGIAGAKGPQFKSCEIKCGAQEKSPCPDGTKCTTIADGPGQVCR
jgi:hypothetical protein